jgi:hypothetical protein
MYVIVTTAKDGTVNVTGTRKGRPFTSWPLANRTSDALVDTEAYEDVSVYLIASGD